MPMKKQAKRTGHRIILIDILKKEKCKRFVEVGVLKCGTTKQVMEGVPDLKEYWAVDPWKVDRATSRSERKRGEESWLEMHQHGCGLMIDFPQLKIVNMISEHAYVIFPDGYFDMIYIDAVHKYEYVHADIGYWLPKVRKGGIISGHDYGGKWKGVKKAVDEWFGEKNIKYWEIDEVWIKRV